MDSEQGRGLVAIHVRDPLTNAIVPVVVEAGTNRLEVVPIGGVPVAPGTVITTSVDAVVGVGATVALTVPPVGTRRFIVENTSGAGIELRVREVGGAAGSGFLIFRGGSREFGGPGGAVAAVEVENVLGAAGAAMIQFEG